MEDKYDYEQPDLPWNPNPIDEMIDPQLEYEAYPDTLTNVDQVDPILKQNPSIPRDPRSRYPENLTEDYLNDLLNRSRKKNLSDETDSLTPNDYKNVKASRTRLLHDLNDLPNEILRQTFERNKALRQSRDSKNGKEVKKEVKNIELPETLWDLESEKEMEDRQNGYYRGKRDVTDNKIRGIPKVTSTGKFYNTVMGVEVI